MLLVLPIVLLGCAGTPSVSDQPTASAESLRSATTELRRRLALHQAAIEGSLAAVDDGDALAEAHRATYREHLATLGRLEAALAAADGEVRHPHRDAGVTAAVKELATAVLGSLYSLRGSEALAWGQGRPVMHLGQFRQVSEGAEVVEAAVPLLDPPATDEQAKALITVAHVLADQDLASRDAAALLTRASERLGQDVNQALTDLEGRIRWARGHDAVRDGRVDDGLVLLAPAGSELRGLALETSYAGALQKAGRTQEAAVRWAMLEATGRPQGLVVLAGHVGPVDVEAARADPRVVALRTAREAEMAERDARRRPVDTLQVETRSGVQSLDTLRRDRAALVLFWRRTCGVCLDEMEVVARLQGRYGSRVALLMVNVDEDPAESRAVLQEKGWSDLAFLPLVTDAERSAARIGVVPDAVYLDRNGEACARIEGYDGDAEALEDRLGALATVGGCKGAAFDGFRAPATPDARRE